MVGSFSNMLVRQLASTTNASELQTLLDGLSSRYDFENWHLLERQIIGGVGREFEASLSLEQKCLHNNNRLRNLLETSQSIDPEKSIYCDRSETITYWKFSQSKWNKVSNSSDANQNAFDYVIVDIPIRHGVEYLLAFENNAQTPHSKLDGDLILAALITWMTIRNFPKFLSNSRTKLAVREQQVLRWTSKGKTSFEISKILELSEHTINNYLANATRKMGANNRVQTVCEAMQLGLI